MHMSFEGLRSTPLSALTYAFFDCETTGLLPRGGDRIAEIAICRRAPGGGEVWLDTLLDGERAPCEEASRRNGLTRERLAGHPTFADVLPQVCDLIAPPVVLVAHNARFDIGFLGAELGRAGVTWEIPPVLDTLALARLLYRFSGNTLAGVAERLGHQVVEVHRARPDVETLIKIWGSMLPTLEQGGVGTLGQVLDWMAYQKGRKGRKRSA